MPLEDQIDPLVWWKVQQCEYPTLSRIAKDYLSIQAISMELLYISENKQPKNPRFWQRKEGGCLYLSINLLCFICNIFKTSGLKKEGVAYIRGLLIFRDIRYIESKISSS